MHPCELIGTGLTVKLMLSVMSRSSGIGHSIDRYPKVYHRHRPKAPKATRTEMREKALFSCPFVLRSSWGGGG
eukprot:2873498-Amphidinium_carterae.1